MTAPSTSSLTAHRALAAGRLWHAAAAVLAAMPLCMAIAHRSSPTFLGLSAALALAALGLERRFVATLERLWVGLNSPLGLAVLAFFAWTLLSVLWSDAPELSLRVLGEFWLSVVGAFVLATILPERMKRAGFWLLAASIAAACLLVLVELQTDVAIRQAFGQRAFYFLFNRTSLTILILSTPLLLQLHRGSAEVRGRRLIEGVIGALVVATIALSQSGAAKLGLIIIPSIFVAVRLAPRLSLWGAVVAVVVLVSMAPVMGRIADRLIPVSMHDSLENSHSRERVDIWLSFSAVVEDQPLHGFGIGVSSRMAEMPVAARVPPQLRTWLPVGHPHNAALQVWVELGMVGAALGLAVVLLMLRRLKDLPAGRLAPRLAMFAAVAAISLVGHGAWQGWWPAAIGAAIVWLRSAERLSKETLHEHL